MNSLVNQQDMQLAISLSGGGHRATLFTLGALMYLVDAKANAFVTSIASVSGGSLTNGVVGQTLDFRSADCDTFRAQVAKPLATQIAKSGTLFAPLLTKVYLAVLIAGLIAALSTFVMVPGAWYARLLAFILALIVWSCLLGMRGLVCERAFRTTLFSSPDGRATPLSALKAKGLDHVICATELRAGEQMYFSGEFVYAFLFGHGRPAELTLAQAVQASAAFPGGFPPAVLSTKGLALTGGPKTGGPPKPPTELVMTDGGVYDNMGDQWARGFDNRVKSWKELGVGRETPNQLVVVNASARIPWNPFSRRLIPLIGEVAAFIRVNNVMYINTTNVRRQAIVDSYDPEHPELASKLPGALVQISQSPFVVAERYASGTTSLSVRAQAVLALLNSGPFNKEEWAKIARENSAVGTSLNKMGTEVSAKLIYQGYVVTMCNLHVLFGGVFSLQSAQLAFERFRELIS